MGAETPSQRRLASALISLKSLQDSGLTVLHTNELSRDDRESLVDAGFLKPVIKGWYMPSRPGEGDGETTAWYASANAFIARYCEERFGAEWCVGADHSIRLHAGNSALPAQVVVNAPAGGNSVVKLPAGHSILDYKAKDFPAAGKTSSRETPWLRVATTWLASRSRRPSAGFWPARTPGSSRRGITEPGTASFSRRAWPPAC